MSSGTKALHELMLTNTVAAEGLVIQGARVSTGIVLTFFATLGRVNISISLNLVMFFPRFSTYFVEYHFPVVTAGNRLTVGPSSMGTEVIRVASKRVEEGGKKDSGFLWISNYIHCKVWDKITYPFPNFKWSLGMDN